MARARVFTIEEVDALIPELSRLVDAQLSLNAQIEKLLRDLARELGEVPTSLETTSADTETSRRLKGDLGRLMQTFKEGWGQIQELGAVVKDPQIGLLDFYGRIDGRLVWFCWRFGEARLGFYHELDAGFAGRRELRSDTRTKLMN